MHVIVHEDPSVQIAAFNLLYKVGSRNEDPHKTGFAHLFEHLMFGGSINIPSYDEPLQMVGGENNAFTNTDITNYYITLPAVNLETAFWLESDRMLSLSFDPKVLEVQQKVVIEEFKQRYLNQPYGDVWLKLRPLSYKVHPYQWATIGKDIRHIEDATMEDVRNFFFKYYVPSNAVLVVAGRVTVSEVERLAKKWFGPIQGTRVAEATLPQEPEQTAKRTELVQAKVPARAIYKCWHMPGRFDKDYYAYDLLADVLGRGQSSRLYQRLVKETKMYTSVSAFTTGTIDPGQLIMSGRLREGVTSAEGEAAMNEVIATLQNEGINPEEMVKVRNQAISTLEFGEVEVLNRAMGLAFAQLSGDTGLVNSELDQMNAVEMADVMAGAATLTEARSSVLYYEPETV